MWLERLTGKRDLLVPYFNFHREVKRNRQSALLLEIFQLRYEVYCLECGYLPSEEFRDGLETDEFDACSIHFAAKTLDDLIVGTVRLVQPALHQRYPFEGHCSVFDDFVFPPREQAGEISRLVVKKTYRRRRGDTMQGVSKDFMDKDNADSIVPHGSSKKRVGESPLLLLGLYRELYRYSRESGIRYWYAAMERSLAKSLDKMGFRFVPIGPQTDYYGPVTPFIVDLDELDARLRKENKFLAAWFNDEPISYWILVQTWFMFITRKKRKMK